MKKVYSWLFVVVMVVGLLFGPTKPVSAMGPCISEDEVTFVPYMKTGEEVIPVGGKVTFLPLCEDTTKMVVQYDDTIGFGVSVSYYSFSDTTTEIEFHRYSNPGVTSEYDWDQPETGDTGYISSYADSQDSEGNWNSDGIVDTILVVQNRMWTKAEAQLLKISDEYYQDLVDQHLIMLFYSGDCELTFFIDGSPLQAGPWGGTYIVSAGGGRLQAMHKAGTCGYQKNTFEWSAKVNPGDAVVDQDFIFPMNKEMDPWYFCDRLEDQVPAWQSKDPRSSLPDECHFLFNKEDDSTMAVLGRLGFLRGDLRFGDNLPENQVPFVWYGAEHGVKWAKGLPKFHWSLATDKIELNSGSAYAVSTDKQCDQANVCSYQPIFQLTSGDRYGTDDTSSDIPFFGTWGDPILFVPVEVVSRNYQLDWSEVEIFRVMQLNYNTAYVQKLVWDE